VRRRLFNLAFNLACAFSAILLLSAGALGVRGLWVQDLTQVSYQWYPEPHLWNARWFSIRSANDRFEFGVVRNDFDLGHPAGIVSDGGSPGWVEKFRRENRRGLSFDSHSARISPTIHYATVGDRAFGFGVSHEDHLTKSRHDEYWTLSLPAWFVMLLCAILPAIWFGRQRRSARRRHQGLCPTCGYDLRATPDRCPECGTQVTPAELRSAEGAAA
jgi:hypothetical protein